MSWLLEQIGQGILYIFFTLFWTSPIWALYFSMYYLWQDWTGQPVPEDSIEAAFVDECESLLVFPKTEPKNASNMVSEYDDKYKLPDPLFED